MRVCCTHIDSSSDSSSITPCVWVFLQVFANVRVSARARVLGVFHRIANTSPRSESPIGTETSVE